MSSSLPQKLIDQMKKAGLPRTGAFPFEPMVNHNQKGDPIIEKRAVLHGPKSGKRGYVDDQGRIWLRDRAHAAVPDHWDVQIDGGHSYFRVDDNGNLLP